jgi:NADH-quinone oxidoreductase subunit H
MTKTILLLVAVYCGILVPSAGIINYLNRKFTADLQGRVGPNRAGAAGFLQPIADFLKSLQKTAELRPLTGWELVLFWIQSLALYATVAILPLGSMILSLDTDMGVLIVFWTAFTLALMSLFLGLERSSVPGWLSAVRVAVQAVTGAFPAVLALFCVGMEAKGLRWTQISDAQGAFPFSWMIFQNPFEWLAFFVFMVSGLILFSLAPMDTGLARADILGGFSSSLYGRRLSLFNFGRFYGFFLWSVIASVLFLGGWSIPQSLRQSLLDSGSSSGVFALELMVVIGKSYVLMLLVNLIVKANPKARVDQITDFSWRVLSPVALVATMGCALWISGRLLL